MRSSCSCSTGRAGLAPIVIRYPAMSVFLSRRPVRAALIYCLLVLQGHLLWLSMLHQHPLTAFARRASTAVSQGGSQPYPPVATELTCNVCQIFRHSLALPVTAFQALHAAASISRLLLFCPADYHFCQSTVVLWRAPPLSYPSPHAGPRFVTAEPAIDVLITPQGQTKCF